MNVTSQVDLREFNAAMRQLSTLSKREFADVANDNMADLLLTAARYMPKTLAAKVRDIKTRPWWPAYITKVINRGFTLTFRRKAKTKSQREVHWIDTPTGRTMHGRKTMSVSRNAAIKRKALRGMFSGQFKGRSDADAKRVSAKLIARRVATIGGFRATLGTLAIMFAPYKERRGGFGKKNLTRTRAYKARPGALFTRAEALISFVSKAKSWPDSPRSPGHKSTAGEMVRWREVTALHALNTAIPEVTARLRYAINKKLERAAKAVEARRIKAGLASLARAE